jgi:hypothetical protein
MEFYHSQVVIYKIYYNTNTAEEECHSHKWSLTLDSSLQTVLISFHRHAKPGRRLTHESRSNQGAIKHACFFSRILQHTLYTRKNAQIVTNLQQTCSNAVPTTCQQDVFALLVPSLLTSCQWLVDNLLQGCSVQQTSVLQVVPTTCYRPAIQQLVNKLWVTSL